MADFSEGDTFQDDDLTGLPISPGLAPLSDSEHSYAFMGLANVDAEGYYQAGMWARDDAPAVPDFFANDYRADLLQSSMQSLENFMAEAMQFYSDFKTLNPKGIRRQAYATAQQALNALEDCGLSATEYARITMINGFYYIWVDPKADKANAKRRKQSRRKGRRKAA
jgi:hypothetical protein